jgi:hypothetical protein
MKLWEYCPAYLNEGRATDRCKFTESDTILEFMVPGDTPVQRPGPTHWSCCKHENCLFVMTYQMIEFDTHRKNK